MFVVAGRGIVVVVAAAADLQHCQTQQMSVLPVAVSVDFDGRYLFGL